VVVQAPQCVVVFSAVQVPPQQPSPVPQACPHVPQLLGSASLCVSQPSSGVGADGVEQLL